MPRFEKLTHIENHSESSFKLEKLTHNFGGDHKYKSLVPNENLVSLKMNKAETDESVLRHEVCDIGESTGDIFDQLHKIHEFTILTLY